MYCKYCAANLPDNAKFCSSCGATASASEERVEPTKAVKPEHMRDKPGDQVYKKGEDYYSTENTLMNHDIYESDIYTKQNRNNYVQKEVKYAENFSFNNGNAANMDLNQANITSVNDVSGINPNNTKLGIVAKLGIVIASLGIGVAIGYFVGNILL